MRSLQVYIAPVSDIVKLFGTLFDEVSERPHGGRQHDRD